ncbi:MAG: DUF2306 domain-containing protein [Myxococcota bacterium]
MTWTVLALGSTLVVLSSLPYLLPGELHPFLLERPELTADTLWRSTLVVHVAAGIFALPVGLLLMSQRLLRRFPAIHRRLGRLYFYVVLVGMVPSGSYLAFFAKGGWAAGSGFFLSGVFVAYALVRSIRQARALDFRGHRDWMFRAYGQLASAISFRVFHVALQFTGMGYEELYISSLWLSVLGNALLVELAIALTSTLKPAAGAARRPLHASFSHRVGPVPDLADERGSVRRLAEQI